MQELEAVNSGYNELWSFANEPPFRRACCVSERIRHLPFRYDWSRFNILGRT
jgi:hypothetical protein